MQHPHKEAAFVTVSDETESPVHFVGIRLGPQPSGDDPVNVFVIFDGRESGFSSTSPQVLPLKHLSDNTYGA